jgi:hypothetical protein
MDLLKQPSLKKEVKYTCPMHPEIIQDGLVPAQYPTWLGSSGFQYRKHP